MIPTTKFGPQPRLLIGGVLAAAALLAPQALVQQAFAQEDYYANRDITMIVAFSPGGGYDLWARVVADHLGKHLPGEPNIIVENMPGASTLVATNHITNVSPRDGTVIGVVGRDVFLEPMLGSQEVQFDLGDITFIGSAATETNVCAAMATAEVQTVEDLFETDLMLGSQSPGNGTYSNPAALREILGLRFDIISGYESGTAINLAMEQGEVDAVCQSYDSLATRYPQWIEDGTLNILFQGGIEPDPSVDAPFILDYAETDEQRAQIRFLYAGQFFGRPFIAPAIDDETLQLLRDAFEALADDEAFLAAVDRLGYEFLPVSGEAMQAVADELTATPPEIIDFIGEVTR